MQYHKSKLISRRFCGGLHTKFSLLFHRPHDHKENHFIFSFFITQNKLTNNLLLQPTKPCHFVHHCHLMMLVIVLLSLIPSLQHLCVVPFSPTLGTLTIQSLQPTSTFMSTYLTPTHPSTPPSNQMKISIMKHIRKLINTNKVQRQTCSLKMPRQTFFGACQQACLLRQMHKCPWRQPLQMQLSSFTT